ncbi:SDR family oxidoreductase [Jatrophihabitans sp. DSM 45814]
MTSQPTGLSGRVALVAGGTQGLGLAAGRALAAAGASVVLGGRRADVAAQEAQTLGGAIGVRLDITDQTSIRAAAELARSQFGKIDIVILNGGGPPRANAATVKLDDARSAAELLLYGPIALAQLALGEMGERGWGRIVAVGSSSVQQPVAGLVSSGMFRAALANYLKTLAGEVARGGITVNMVVPGRIATDRVAYLDAAMAQSLGREAGEVERESQAAIPAGRYGRPEEFADVVAFLCSDAAQYVNGSQIRVDGGMIRGI